MGATLSQIIKRHFPAQQAETIKKIVSQTPLPVGRLSLYSLQSKEHIPIVFPEQHPDLQTAGIPIEIDNSIPLEDLVITWRDLEEEQGMLPSSIEAAEYPRVQPIFSIYGIDNGDSIALLIAEKSQDKELSAIPNLHKLQEFDTYRFFVDYRDDIDHVTKLNTRRFLDQKIAALQNMGLLQDYNFIVGDLDHFKSLNEKFGYDAGNLGLKIMGQEINKALGPDGIGSRRRYGDETASIALKELFLEFPGGPEQWARNLNSQLAQRSSELPGEFNLRISLGVYSIGPEDNYSDIKRKADQALIYAKTHGSPLVVWHKGLPTHNEMSSGAYLRYDDRELIQFGTAAKRSFPGGLRPDQLDGFKEIVSDIQNTSPPLREAGNRKALDKLTHHLILAHPDLVKYFTEEKVWQSIYQTRATQGLLTEMERTLAGDPLKIKEYLSERLNLEFLLTDDLLSEQYNQDLILNGIHCRYDDAVKTIEESQRQSRYITSGHNVPSKGEIKEFGHLLNLLAKDYYPENLEGIVEIYKETNPEKKIMLPFNDGSYDINAVYSFLDRKIERRVANYIGLTDVEVTSEDKTPYTGDYDYHNFSASCLSKLEPIFVYADNKETPEPRHAAINSGFRINNMGNKRYSLQIPLLPQLIFERSLQDHDYCDLFYPKPEGPWSGKTTRIMRRPSEVTMEQAISFINKRYSSLDLRSRLPNFPIFHGSVFGTLQLLSDLYKGRDIYLSKHNDQFIISQLRVPEIETPEPTMDEVVTMFAREIHSLFEGSGRVLYEINEARPARTSNPRYVKLERLMIPVGLRYNELYNRNC